jgi:hypothetical protein
MTMMAILRRKGRLAKCNAQGSSIVSIGIVPQPG